MKLIILIGGFTGFGVGMFFGWANQSPWPSVIWRSCAAAYAAAFLLRWWGRLWIKSIYQAQYERRQNEAQRVLDAASSVPLEGEPAPETPLSQAKS